MQRTQVWSLVLEDSTCQEATKPMSHNYWAHELQIPKHTHPRAHAPQEMPPQQEAQKPQWRIDPAHHN